MISVIEAAQILSNNRLLLDDGQINNFEEALEILAAPANAEHIGVLFQGFDDATEHYEVMFGLVHIIESLDEVAPTKVFAAHFIDAVPSLVPHAVGWAETLLLRVLNHAASRDIFREQLKKSRPEVHKFITSLLKNLAAKRPEQFHQKVKEVLS